MKKTVSLLIFLVFSATLLSGLLPSSRVSAAPVSCVPQNLLLYPAWFQGLQCEVENGKNKSVVIQSSGDVAVIALNLVQWLIITAGYAALIFIIIGGFNYIIAAGAPDKVKVAKSTLTNAIIGLVIALMAVAIVKTIQGVIV